MLKQAGAFSMMGAAAPLAMNLAAASALAAPAATDYRALVCVFLYGGNDAFNTVLATDDPSWSNYAAVRNQQPESIALLRNAAPNRNAKLGSPEWLGGVLPISAASMQSGRSFAMHPMLGGLQAMFNTSRRLAVVANVGSLVEPLSKTDYLQGQKRKPKKLFSHNDQQSTWMAMAPEGTAVGWGGRLADAVASANNSSLFTAISASGESVWLSGETVRQYQVSPAGPVRMGTQPDSTGVSRVYGSDVVGAALERIVTSSRNQHVMAADMAAVNQRSIQAERILSGALPSEALAPYGPASALQYTTLAGGRAHNSLAQQLQVVARTIAAHGSLGVKRQVFFVSMGGFDTHNNQNLGHADLMAKLNHAMQYFDTTLSAMGVAQQVTTFTASDFGRSFTSNGDGSDHGWGAHHLVMGGAVQGGDVHGDFPVLGKKNQRNNQFDASPDQISNGILLPKVSVDQYGAALGQWFGLSPSQLPEIFPNLANFSGASRLALMKA
ncbi:DUF1501 domain-containing protein [Aquabacterium sp.]|uniref:DUF1501 domain-containing protein n=1 Tax=Aquabacterium sp. TaxID=1872578 RepID=UPI0025C4E30C|nr:DUF1501 domain-containing protein [Aquabacterium sp.]